MSRHHARIEAAQGGYWIADLGSRNGTKLNGERFSGESRWLANGDTIEIGGEALRFLAGEETRIGAGPQQPVDRHAGRSSSPATASRSAATAPTTWSSTTRTSPASTPRSCAVGRPRRGPRPRLAQRHAGERRARSRRAARARLRDRDRPVPPDLRRRRRSSRATSTARCGSTPRASTMDVGDKQILAETTLSIEPGQLVAFIGESGSGKTTLLKALAGVTTPTGGRDHRQRRAGQRPPHRHRLPAPGRDRPPGPDA